MRKYRMVPAMAFLVIWGISALQANNPPPPDREYYEITVYSFNTQLQEKMIDRYLKDAFLPGMHRAGIKNIGVFKPAGNDTASAPKIYVLIPYRLLEDIEKVSRKLMNDKEYQSAGNDYSNAAFSDPPYKRMEKIILRAFSTMPLLKVPIFNTPRAERIYELRSYESATEKLYKTKIKMFNAGGETAIFEHLGFNAVFYGEVLAGSAMPNLMYMTTFANRESREQHWKSFKEHPDWKKLSSEKEYEHSVSKQDIMLLHPADYSDY